MEPAARGEPRGVDGPSDIHVHLVDGQVVGEGHRTRTGQIEDLESGEVDHADVLPEGQVFGVDDRRPPAAVPFGVPLGDAVLFHQRGVVFVPLGPFPDAGLVENRPEGLLAGIERALGQAPVGLPLLEGVDYPVGLVEVLPAAGANVVVVAFLGVEAGNVGAVRVGQMRVAVSHPLGDQLTDARPLLDPYRGGRPQVLDLDCLTDHRHGVRGEGEESVDGVLDLGVPEHLHQLDGLFHRRVEVVLAEGQLGGREGGLLVRRDGVGVVEDRSVGVGPDLHRSGGLALVAEGVHVAHDRVADFVVGGRQDVDGSDVGHLVDGRGEGDRGPGHVGQTVGPHTTCDNHVIRYDPAPVGDHGVDSGNTDGVFDRFEVEHLRVGEDL